MPSRQALDSVAAVKWVCQLRSVYSVVKRVVLVHGLALLAYAPTGCSDSDAVSSVAVGDGGRLPDRAQSVDERDGTGDEDARDETVEDDAPNGDVVDADEASSALKAMDWRVVVAPARTVYRAPHYVDDNVNGWWDKNQLHFEPGDWGRNGAPITQFIGSNLQQALDSAPSFHTVHPSRRNPDGCQGKVVCFWAEGTYNAGNGMVYALVEDEGWATCGGIKGHWRMAIAKSTDNGATFDDAGIVLDEPGDDNCTGAGAYISAGAGDGSWIIGADGYAYVVYSAYGGTWSADGGSQGLSVARILLTDLAAPVESDVDTGEPIGPSKLKKWYAARGADGAWKKPDAAGKPTEVLCTEANDCFNSDGVTGPSTPIPGSHPSVDHFTTGAAQDLWYFPYGGKVRRGNDAVDVILASHLSASGEWFNHADKVGAWFGDVTHPGSFVGPTTALKPCHGSNGIIGSYTTLFGDRADTFDTSSVMSGENADGTPRPIPLFGVTYPPDLLPSANWTFTLCKPGETEGACRVPTGGGTFRIGTDISCPM
jgi:hypothetical protein